VDRRSFARQDSKEKTFFICGKKVLHRGRSTRSSVGSARFRDDESASVLRREWQVVFEAEIPDVPEPEPWPDCVCDDSLHHNKRFSTISHEIMRVSHTLDETLEASDSFETASTVASDTECTVQVTKQYLRGNLKPTMFFSSPYYFGYN